MDDADRADARIQNVIDGGLAIAADKVKKMHALLPCRECYYCAHTLSDGWVFCDTDCQNDYYHMLRREKELGL